LELPTDRSTFAAAGVAETRKEVADVTNPRTSASATPDVMAVVTVVPLLSMRILLANSPLVPPENVMEAEIASLKCRVPSNLFLE